MFQKYISLLSHYRFCLKGKMLKSFEDLDEPSVPMLYEINLCMVKLDKFYDSVLLRLFNTTNEVESELELNI